MKRTRVLFGLGLTVAIAVGTQGCGGGDPSINTAMAQVAQIDFSIIEDDRKNVPIKRSVEVQLNEPLDERELAILAGHIKTLERRNVTRTFIGYRLADQSTDQPYWATTHYNTELEVKIYQKVGVNAERNGGDL